MARRRFKKKCGELIKRRLHIRPTTKKNPVLRFFKVLVARTNQAKVSYVFSTSERVSSYYPETFMTDADKIIELGQARNDVFYYDSAEDEQVPEYMKENKIITYMPTHRNHGKGDKSIQQVFRFQRLNQFCKDNGYLFIVKRHMYSKGKIPTNLSHIKDISHTNIDPQLVLKYTNILITDYSSCYTDFLLLNRPVLFLLLRLREISVNVKRYVF